MISFIEACSQQQACPGNFARVRYFHYSPLLWGEERVMLDNELGSITFQLYFLNVETIFIVSVDMIPCKCFSRNGIIY